MEILFRKNYHLGQLVSETAYSKVYKATEINSSRVFCIKEIDLSIVPDKNARSGLLALVKREVQALTLAGDRIAKIPCIFDYYHNQNENKVYIIMQWIEGDSLRKCMSSPPEIFLRYILNLAEILQELHNLHIYHKDIKPENIITVGSDVRLIDFNISLSLPNIVEGTYCYAAPEMTSPNSKVLREYCDVFALGVILYEYFTGEVPVNGVHYADDWMNPDSLRWAEYKTAKERAAEKGKTPVSEEMDRIITKCMRNEPTQRYGSMNAFIHDFRKAMRGYYGKR